VNNHSTEDIVKSLIRYYKWLFQELH
jgi:hypothetical protein